MQSMFPVFSRSTKRRIFLIVFCILVCYLTPGVLAADAYYTGYLGDVIDLHGYSYRGGEVYLFMTGPGLPANGVTLTDVTQRADQGHFTMIDVDSDYQWYFKWDTSRIWNEIDPGTYLVYVTTEPVDYSNLGGSSTYQTLSVYLKDAGQNTGISSGGSYTLRPVAQDTTMTTTTNTPATTVTTTELPLTTAITTPVPQDQVTLSGIHENKSAVPVTTKAGMTLFPILCGAVIAGACLIGHSRYKRK